MVRAKIKCGRSADPSTTTPQKHTAPLRSYAANLFSSPLGIFSGEARRQSNGKAANAKGRAFSPALSCFMPTTPQHRVFGTWTPSPFLKILCDSRVKRLRELKENRRLKAFTNNCKDAVSKKHEA
jgi:hypothetical protein